MALSVPASAAGLRRLRRRRPGAGPAGRCPLPGCPGPSVTEVPLNAAPLPSCCRELPCCRELVESCCRARACLPCPRSGPGEASSGYSGEQFVAVEHDHVLADLALGGGRAEAGARRRPGQAAAGGGRVGHRDDEGRVARAWLVPG